MEVLKAIAELTGTPVALDVAKSRLPKSGGLYAWWMLGSALPGVLAPKHPAQPDLSLLYIGIAPNGQLSSATLHSRVVGNHMTGNIAASTLRRTLASLLIETLALQPIKKVSKKIVLPRDQNTRLSAWQKEHLRLTWHPTPQPWILEASVISSLRPPLNLADNETHPFYEKLVAARRALNLAAKEASDRIRRSRQSP